VAINLISSSGIHPIFAIVSLKHTVIMYKFLYLNKLSTTLLLFLVLSTSLLLSTFLFATPVAANVNNPAITINADYDLKTQNVKIVNVGTGQEYFASPLVSLGNRQYVFEGTTLLTVRGASASSNTYKGVVTIDGRSA
jgi:hypothetical protein